MFLAGKLIQRGEFLALIDMLPLTAFSTFKIVETVVKVGDTVKEGDHLCYIERNDPSIAVSSTENFDAYLRFVRIGLMLAEDSVVKRFEDFIEKIFLPEVREACPAPPFCFILASSGFGKSQFPFALVNQKILYIPLALSQDIYKTFSALALLFQECVLKDISLYFPDSPTETWPYSCSKLDLIMNKKLFTIGAFYAIFRQMKDYGVFDPRKLVMTTQIVPMYAHALTEKYIVFLDEFSPALFTNEQLQFFRNVCRLLRIPLIVMGTNSSAANMFNYSPGASRYGSSKWVFIWRHLPQYAECLREKLAESVESFCSARQCLSQTANLMYDAILTERPLIIHAFHNFIESPLPENCDHIQLLENFIQYLRDSLLNKKPTLDFAHNIMASLFFMRDESKDRETTYPFSFINDHMAIFTVSGTCQDDSEDFYETFLVNGSPYTKIPAKSYIVFKNRRRVMDGSGAYFRPFTSEFFLRLAFGGIYNVNWCHGSGSTCLQHLKDLRALTAGFEFSQNSKKRNGNLFESLVSVTIVQASRRCGLKGTRLDLFIKGLIENLVSLTAFEKEAIVDLTQFSIPFIGPIDAAWPDYFLAWSNNTLNLSLLEAKTPENKYGVDLAICEPNGKIFMLVECKNRVASLSRVNLQAVMHKFFAYADHCLPLYHEDTSLAESDAICNPPLLVVVANAISDTYDFLDDNLIARLKAYSVLRIVPVNTESNYTINYTIQLVQTGNSSENYLILLALGDFGVDIGNPRLES